LYFQVEICQNFAPKNIYIADMVLTLGHKSLFGAFTLVKCQAKWSEEEKAPP
jgi:hypothetical protein